TSIATTRLTPGPNGADLTDDQWRRLADYVGRAADMDITIDEAADCSLARIKARVNAMERQGRLPHLVVVDYIQLMDTAPAERRDLRIAALSRGLKILAKTKKIVVVALAQARRESADRENGVPRLSDLAESSALEKDPNVVLTVSTPHVDDPEHERSGETIINVAKDRGGPLGEGGLACQFHYSRCANLHRQGAVRADRVEEKKRGVVDRAPPPRPWSMSLDGRRIYYRTPFGGVGSLRARTTVGGTSSPIGGTSGVPIIKPGHTKRGPAYPGNNHTPGKAGPHSCSISETASANTACSTASPKKTLPKRRACIPTPSKSSSRAAPRAWTPSTASPVPSTQPPAASSPAVPDCWNTATTANSTCSTCAAPSPHPSPWTETRCATTLNPPT